MSFKYKFNRQGANKYLWNTPLVIVIWFKTFPSEVTLIHMVAFLYNAWILLNNMPSIFEEADLLQRQGQAMESKAVISSTKATKCEWSGGLYFPTM